MAPSPSVSACITVDARKTRWRPTAENKALLEQCFRACDLPSDDLVQTLAKTVDVRPRQIRVWFQNRRQRSKTPGTSREQCTPETEARLMHEVNEQMMLGGLRPVMPFGSNAATIANLRGVLAGAAQPRPTAVAETAFATPLPPPRLQPDPASALLKAMAPLRATATVASVAPSSRQSLALTPLKPPAPTVPASAAATAGSPPTLSTPTSQHSRLAAATRPPANEVTMREKLDDLVDGYLLNLNEINALLDRLAG